MQSKIVLVVPCFNESSRFSKEYFGSLQSELSCDLLFVDDGSSDNTFDLINNFGPQATAIRLPINVGKSKAVATGLMLIRDKYDWIGVCDADAAISIQDWKTGFGLGEAHKDLDLIIGARILLAGMPITRRASRKWIGRVVATFVSLLLNTQIYDPQSPCKVYSTTFLKSIPLERVKTKWFFDAEALLWSERKSSIREFSLTNWQDVPGSHLSIRSIFRVTSDLSLLIGLKVRLLKMKKGLKNQQA